jgi:hypothetical protein
VRGPPPPRVDSGRQASRRFVSPSQCAGRVHPGRRNPGRHELAVIEPSRDRSSKPSSPTPHPTANGVGATTDAQARGQSRTQLHPSRVTRTRRIRGNRICGFTAKTLRIRYQAVPHYDSSSRCVAITCGLCTVHSHNLFRATAPACRYVTDDSSNESARRGREMRRLGPTSARARPDGAAPPPGDCTGSVTQPDPGGMLSRQDERTGGV